MDKRYASEILQSLRTENLATEQVIITAENLLERLKSLEGYSNPNVGPEISDEPANLIEFFWCTPPGMYIIIQAESFELIDYRQKQTMTSGSIDDVIQYIQEHAIFSRTEN